MYSKNIYNEPFHSIFIRPTIKPTFKVQCSIKIIRLLCAEQQREEQSKSDILGDGSGLKVCRGWVRQNSEDPKPYPINLMQMPCF